MLKYLKYALRTLRHPRGTKFHIMNSGEFQQVGRIRYIVNGIRALNEKQSRRCAK